MKKFNICIVEPEDYIHSGAFHELAELLFFALQELGHPVTLTKNRFDSSARNILIGIHLLDAECIQLFPGDSIIINTEQLSGSYAHWNENILKWFSAGFELWDYSDPNIEYLKSAGISDVKKLNIGFQRELRRIPGGGPHEIDVLFYGAVNERRHAILTRLEERGLVVKRLFGVYGGERDVWIGKSKIVLNHHFYASQIFEVLRVFYLMTNSIAVIGEVSASTQIEPRFKEGIVSAPYDALVDTVVELVHDNERLAYWRAKGYETLARYPQIDYVRELI